MGSSASMTPWLTLAGDAGGEECLSGWSTDEDPHALAALGVGTLGASLRPWSGRWRGPRKRSGGMPPREAGTASGA
ncbi:hypothetical protein [Streptomyces sp. NPDC058701]|uniref:hypothetical protein n=1 Tax=Streptomyces sp. NPDC058701 TaxID=3346608 RepID=UPI00365BFCC9